jgi:hypothetical protein
VERRWSCSECVYFSCSFAVAPASSANTDALLFSRRRSQLFIPVSASLRLFPSAFSSRPSFSSDADFPHPFSSRYSCSTSRYSPNRTMLIPLSSPTECVPLPLPILYLFPLPPRLLDLSTELSTSAALHPQRLRRRLPSLNRSRSRPSRKPHRRPPHHSPHRRDDFRHVRRNKHRRRNRFLCVVWSEFGGVGDDYGTEFD